MFPFQCEEGTEHGRTQQPSGGHQSRFHLTTATQQQRWVLQNNYKYVRSVKRSKRNHNKLFCEKNLKKLKLTPWSSSLHQYVYKRGSLDYFLTSITNVEVRFCIESILCNVLERKHGINGWNKPHCWIRSEEFRKDLFFNLCWFD